MNSFLLLWETSCDIRVVDCMLFQILSKIECIDDIQVVIRVIPSAKFLSLRILCYSYGSRIFDGGVGIFHVSSRTAVLITS
jgi:hypothetical protein